MKSWFDTSGCKSHAHCRACRNSRNFRESIFKHGQVPQVDFACPLGIQIGETEALPEVVGGGVGTELKKLLSRFWITADGDCACDKHARTMDENGIGWCEKNINTIIGWLREAAAKRKKFFSECGAKTLVRWAIRNAKKSLQRYQ